MNRARTLRVALALGPAAGALQAQPQPPEPSRQRTIELAHQVVAAAAIDTLPKQLKGFYKDHRAEMPSLALEPEFPARGPGRRFLGDRQFAIPFAALTRPAAG